MYMYYLHSMGGWPLQAEDIEYTYTCTIYMYMCIATPAETTFVALMVWPAPTPVETAC